MLPKAYDFTYHVFGGNSAGQASGKKGAAILSRMAEQQTVVVNRLGSDRAEMMGYYRFLRNERVEPGLILGAIQSHCKQALMPRHYLCLQDTTELNYAHNNGRRDPFELGLVGNDVDHGLFAHVCLMVDAVELCAVGVGNVELWGRDNDNGQHEKGKSGAGRDKESKRWVDGPNKAKEVLPEGAKLTVVGDREMDKFEVMAQVPDHQTDFLLRSNHNRLLANSQKLYDFFATFEHTGVRRVQLPARKGRPEREASLEIRFGKVAIPRTSGVAADLAKEVEVHWVEAKEADHTVPKGEKRVHWRLLTSHSVETLEEALQMVEWYSARWQIEQLFRTLKSKGLGIEESQLETARALKNLVLIALQTSLHIMQLTYSRSGGSVYSATAIFRQRTLLLLELLNRKYEGKTKKQQNPYTLHSIQWARWVVARMGGWDGYESGSRAGPITIHRGLIKLYTMEEAMEIFVPEDV